MSTDGVADNDPTIDVWHAAAAATDDDVTVWRPDDAADANATSEVPIPRTKPAADLGVENAGETNQTDLVDDEAHDVTIVGTDVRAMLGATAAGAPSGLISDPADVNTELPGDATDTSFVDDAAELAGGATDTSFANRDELPGDATIALDDFQSLAGDVTDLSDDGDAPAAPSVDDASFDFVPAVGTADVDALPADATREGDLFELWQPGTRLDASVQQTLSPEREIVPARRSWWVAVVIVLVAVVVALVLLAAAIWFQRSDGGVDDAPEETSLVDLSFDEIA